MKTLYVRIVLIFIIIILFSSIAGFFATEYYYRTKVLNDTLERSITVAKSIKTLYEQNISVDSNQFLTHTASLGYQLYWISPSGDPSAYGNKFRNQTLSQEQLDIVFHNQLYNGMAASFERSKLFSYFTNSVQNTIGIPITTEAGIAALYIRPDLQQQIGDVRIIVAVLICSTFLFSLVFIIIMSRFIVRPVNQLAKATRQIAKGFYHIEGLDTSRKDEIGMLAKDFAIMTKEIKQADDMKQQFVADVSHEFQTPLTSIRGLALSATDPAVSSEELQSFLNIIAEESLRLSSLSKQLLLLASLDQEEELQKTRFRVDEQIRQVLIMLEWQWSDKQLQLDLDMPEYWIYGNEPLLYEVWQNLIHNAIKFCKPQDHLIVSIKQDTKSSNNIEIRIEDSGEGIAADELHYIFERFQKVNKSRSSSGSGLGLPIAKKIVSLHQGTINVDSEPNIGTCFTIRLPYKEF